MGERRGKIGGQRGWNTCTVPALVTPDASVILSPGITMDGSPEKGLLLLMMWSIHRESRERKEIRLFQRFSLLGFTRFGSPPAFSAQVCCKIGTSYRHLLLACASPECSPLGPAEHSHKAHSFSVTPSPQGVMPFHTEKLDDSVARDLLEFCFLPDPHTSASDLNGTISNRTTQKSCIACKRRAIA
jgi:hypothetical protein